MGLILKSLVLSLVLCMSTVANAGCGDCDDDRIEESTVVYLQHKTSNNLELVL